MDTVQTTERSSTTRSNLGYQLGFISFTRSSNIVRCCRVICSRWIPKYLRRALLIGATSLAALPLRLLQSVVYGARIRRVALKPIAYLHNRPLAKWYNPFAQSHQPR